MEEKFTNLQLQSSLLTKLPREILDDIYLRLWESHGLKQHIFWHGMRPNKHFCHWTCTSKFDVHDRLQRDIEELRVAHGVQLGDEIRNAESVPYSQRLQSAWLNHWKCGEHAAAEHGNAALSGTRTSSTKCWLLTETSRQRSSVWSPYMPMLLTCKIM